MIADLEHWSKLWDTLAPSMNEIIRLYTTLLRQNMRKCRGPSARRPPDASTNNVAIARFLTPSFSMPAVRDMCRL